MIVAIAQVMTLVKVIIATVATVITQPILIHKMQVLMHINIKSRLFGRLFILDLRGVQKVLEFSSTFCYCSNSWYFESVVLICSSRLLLSCSNKRRL